jgi:hypothetical protein
MQVNNKALLEICRYSKLAMRSDVLLEYHPFCLCAES